MTFWLAEAAWVRLDISVFGLFLLSHISSADECRSVLCCLYLFCHCLWFQMKNRMLAVILVCWNTCILCSCVWLCVWLCVCVCVAIYCSRRIVLVDYFCFTVCSSDRLASGCVMEGSDVCLLANACIINFVNSKFLTKLLQFLFCFWSFVFCFLCLFLSPPKN